MSTEASMKSGQDVAAESESRPCLECGDIIYAGELCTDCVCYFCEQPRVRLAELNDYPVHMIPVLSLLCSDHLYAVASGHGLDR
jgi:hypothetical protein